MKHFILIALSIAPFSVHAMGLESAFIRHKTKENKDIYSTTLPDGSRVIAYCQEGVHTAIIAKRVDGPEEIFSELQDLFQKHKKAKTEAETLTKTVATEEQKK